MWYHFKLYKDMKTNTDDTLIFSNRKAAFNFDVIKTYTAGIVLYGDETSSLKNKNGSISETFCYIDNGEIFIKNMYIKSKPGVVFREDTSERRDRKLLLNKKEIKQLKEEVEQQGMTIIPLKLIRNNKRLYKVIIGLCKGKKMYDKRNDLKEKDIERDIRSKLKQYRYDD